MRTTNSLTEEAEAEAEAGAGKVGKREVPEGRRVGRGEGLGVEHTFQASPSNCEIKGRAVIDYRIGGEAVSTKMPNNEMSSTLPPS